MADKKRNITVTGLSKTQYDWMQKESSGKALTMTTVIKILIEDRMKEDNKK